MFDLEANKAIALRLVEVFNGRRLDLLEDVLHPEFRGRGISAFPPQSPEVGPGARRKLSAASDKRSYVTYSAKVSYRPRTARRDQLSVRLALPTSPELKFTNQARLPSIAPTVDVQ